MCASRIIRQGFPLKGGHRAIRIPHCDSPSSSSPLPQSHTQLFLQPQLFSNTHFCCGAVIRTCAAFLSTRHHIARVPSPSSPNFGLHFSGRVSAKHKAHLGTLPCAIQQSDKRIYHIWRLDNQPPFLKSAGSIRHPIKGSISTHSSLHHSASRPISFDQRDRHFSHVV